MYLVWRFGFLGSNARTLSPHAPSGPVTLENESFRSPEADVLSAPDKCLPGKRTCVSLLEGLCCCLVGQKCKEILSPVKRPNH